MAIHAQENRETFTMPFLALTNRNRTALRAAQQGALHFLNKTLQYNLDALEGFRNCRGLPGLLAVEHEWMSRVMRDSVEQTQRVAKVWWQFAEEAEAAEAPARVQPAMRKFANARKSKHPRRQHAGGNGRAASRRKSKH